MMSLDLILVLYLVPLGRFEDDLVLHLERGGLSESSESDLERGGLILAVIIVLVTVPKNL